jgi:cell division protein FtsQ
VDGGGGELQQVGPVAEIWRRASPSPTPRPVLKLAPAFARRLPARGLARARQARRFIPVFATLLALLLTAGVKLARSETGARLFAKLEIWAQLAGLGLDQVALLGHRYTADKDIFEALELRRARTMLSFDPQRARSRLAELPWIDEASIERVFPDRLEVRIRERTPIAVWSRGERSFLIDADGRTLASVPAEVMPQLPRVSGEGADAAAAELFALTQRFPELKARMASAERIGGRRWTLRLSSGGVVHLPATGEAEGLAEAARLLAKGFERAEIDVRAPARAIVREAPRPSAAQLMASERRPTDRL